MTATFDGQVFVPDQPVDLPIGLRVRVRLIPSAEPTKQPLDLDEVLAGFPENPDAPPDRASQVDHYLYGTPKRP